jgi:hypothetical protein
MRIIAPTRLPGPPDTSIDPGRPAAKRVTATGRIVHCYHAQLRSTRGLLLPTLLPSR